MAERQARPRRPSLSHTVSQLVRQVTTIEVFADVRCPFTHVGLRRLVERRAARGRTDAAVHVRPWPLELVNIEPLDPFMIDEEVAALRAQVAPDLFNWFDPNHFAPTSIPALLLAEPATNTVWRPARRSAWRCATHCSSTAGIADPVLARLAVAAGIHVPPASMRARVLADCHQGQR
jgi:hypothetical protein